jgi:glycine/sarcosine N-methyltransferase
MTADPPPSGRREPATAPEASSVSAFYDGLAEDYHLVYGDGWEAAVARQGTVLDRLIRIERPTASDVLDCSCGVGTQAIGLALRGYRVRGTDISERSLERARDEAARLGVAVAFEVADFRALTTVPGDFDVVLSCDNAVPHLLNDADVERALRAMRSKLRPGGLLVISTRDYDAALVDRPATAPPLLIAGPPRRLFVRFHDWDAAEGAYYTVRFFILTESGAGWTLEQHSARYRAITSDALSQAAERAGFVNVTWHAADTVGYHQPVMTAARSRSILVSDRRWRPSRV